MPTGFWPAGWRRRRDLNPRYLAVCTLSRGVVSATHPLLHGKPLPAKKGVSSLRPLASRPSHAKVGSDVLWEAFLLQLFQFSARQDNYIYCAVGPQNRAFVVDPADAEPVSAFLASRPEITLEAIINTHHHFDHVGGNAALKARYGLKIYGPAHDAERIIGITHPVSIGETISVGGITMKVHDVKAHTRGHICFQTQVPFDEVYRQGHDGDETLKEELKGYPVLFVGDSLFLGAAVACLKGRPSNFTT